MLLASGWDSFLVKLYTAKRHLNYMRGLIQMASISNLAGCYEFLPINFK